jgi:alpha-beta hydrolase superfamily lysophospholipase
MTSVGNAIGIENARARSALPVVFGPVERPLLGMLHAARGAPAQSIGVVLCNPFGHESLCTHRTYRHLAERLAARGFPAMRFDYDGTGDSWGGAEDSGRLAAWVASVRAAIAELRARTGVRQVSLFGVRFGAALAALAAKDQDDVESLIAWAPPRSGEAYVRELRAFRMIKDPHVHREPRTDGAEEVIGYLFTRETLAELGQVDFANGGAPTRALVLTRLQGKTDETKLIETLEKRGTEVRVLSDTGYARMMRDPYLSEPPAATLDAIVNWLAEPRLREALPARALEGAHALAEAREVLESPDLRETPLVFGDDERLFGILTEPVAPVHRNRPVICLLNVGADQHIGPSRMYVDFAREFAALGYPSFRFDIGGLGESRPARGRPEHKLYDVRSIEDVVTALNLLATLRGTRRFILAGLCSGAFLAYQTAIRDERVVGQVLINSFAFEWKEGDPVEPDLSKVTARHGSARHYARALLDRAVWARAIRGKIDWRSVGAFASGYARKRAAASLASLGAWLRGARRKESSVERGFSALCDRGVQSLLISGFDDGGLDMIAQHLGADAERMRARKNFALEVVERVDHTFTPIYARQKLRQSLFRYLATYFP